MLVWMRGDLFWGEMERRGQRNGKFLLGDDRQEGGQKKQQIPFRNDRQNGKGKGKGKRNSRFLSGMTGRTARARATADSFQG
jgi:hypothetical protein